MGEVVHEEGYINIQNSYVVDILGRLLAYDAPLGKRRALGTPPLEEIKQTPVREHKKSFPCHH